MFTFGRTALKNGCIDRAIRNKINAALLQHRIINKVKKLGLSGNQVAGAIPMLPAGYPDHAVESDGPASGPAPTYGF